MSIDALLRKFEFSDMRSPEIQRRAQRSARITAGLEIIAIGVAMPPLYLLSTAMFFDEPSSSILFGAVMFAIVMSYAGLRVIIRARQSYK